jgi:flagellar assembly protein FliH
MNQSSLSPHDVSVLIDHLLKSKDPATVGLRKILKSKQDALDDFPLHPLSYEEFHHPGQTRDAFSFEEKRIFELEKKIRDSEAELANHQEKAKAAVAASYAQGVEDGRARGEEEGRKKAQEDYDSHIVEMQEKIAFLLETIEMSKRKIFTDAHTILLKLCLELTGKIINTECSLNPDVVLSVIKKSLSYIADREKIIVRVAKDDLETVSAKKDFWLPVGERIESIRIESDDRIVKGGCIIESNSGVADARLGVQVAELADFVERIWESVVVAPESFQRPD